MKKNIFIILSLLFTACSITNKLPNQTGTFTDERDGQVYKWVKIGKQTWMAQNLNYKTKRGCWYYDNDTTNRSKYGLYYDFTVIKDACPKGWHVPSDVEWQRLEVSAGMGTVEANKDGYRSDIGEAFLPGKSTGFNLVYAGWHKQDYFAELDESAYFWTSTQSGPPIYSRMFKKGYDTIYRNRFGIAYAMSLRCVKDVSDN